MSAKNEMHVEEICVGVVLYKTDAAAIELMIRSLEHQTGIDAIRVKLAFHSNDGQDRRREIDLLRSKLELKRLTDIEVSIGTNIGFGAAHNLIVGRTKVPERTLYVGANPDGFFHHRALQLLANAARQNGTEALLEARQFPQEHPKTYDHFTGFTHWVSGACFAVNVSYFLSLGGFDENFFMYCEDVDLSWRVRSSGGTCVLVPQALFYHDTNDDRARHWIKLEMLKSGRILGKKWKCDGFTEVMESEMVRLGMADSRGTLPLLKVKPVSYPKRIIDDVTEFHRLFSFSPTRW